MVTPPSFAATFTFNSDGTFNYTHNGLGNTDDSFSYEVSDGIDTATATATIVIVTVNRAPQALADNLADVSEDTQSMRIPFAGLLANDLAGPGEENQSLTIVSVTNAVGGTVRLSTNEVFFTPATNYHGLAGFLYTAQDNGTDRGAARSQNSYRSSVIQHHP